jgi:hypothetical protein
MGKNNLLKIRCQMYSKITIILCARIIHFLCLEIEEERISKRESKYYREKEKASVRQRETEPPFLLGSCWDFFYLESFRELGGGQEKSRERERERESLRESLWIYRGRIF